MTFDEWWSTLDTRERNRRIKEDAAEAFAADKLAESQAREKVLRNALEKIADWYSSWGPYPETNPGWRAMAIVTAREAVPLAIPTDDTALRAVLKAERERVAKHFEPRSYLGSGHQLAIEIRAMGDE